MLLTALAACSWISDDEVAARLDVDGDGIAWPEDCDDGDPLLQTANLRCLGPTNEKCPPADCALDGSTAATHAMTEADELVVADFDGDGLDDVAAGNTSEVYVFGGRGLATTTEEVTVLAPGGGPLAAADLDGNGVADLVLARPGEIRVAVGPWGGSRPWGYLLEGDTTLGTDVAGGPSGLVVGAEFGVDAWVVPALHGAGTIEAEGESLDRPGRRVADPGDLDGDGLDDIALATGPDVTLDLADGVLSIVDVEEMVPGPVGDLDGDGRADLGIGEPVAGRAAVFTGPWLRGTIGMGDGWLLFTDAGAGRSLAGARLDGPALVVASDAGAYLLVDLQGGTLVPADAIVSVPGKALAGAGDIDGDGRDDLVAADSGQVLVFFASDL